MSASTTTQHKHTVESAPRRPSLIEGPTNKALVTCYDEGINKPSDTDTPEIDPGLPSSRHIQRRHSLLSPSQTFMEDPVKSATFSGSQGCPEDTSSDQKPHHHELERSRNPDDDIKLMSNQHDSTAAAERKEENRSDAKDLGGEGHILRGGWMHRSRASCELLGDHKYANVGGD